MSNDNGKTNSDRVAVWEVPLNSGVYMVEFEHGTTTGKRLIRVNGKVCIKKFEYSIF